MKLKPIYIKLSYQTALKIKGNHIPFNEKDERILLELCLQAIICWLIIEFLPSNSFSYILIFALGLVNLFMGIFLCGCKLILEWYYRSALKTIELYQKQNRTLKEENKHE